MEAAPLVLQPPVVAVDETGRREFDAYFTAPALADRLLQELEDGGFWRGGRVLEPSAGRGAFVQAAARRLPRPSLIHANDADPVRVAELSSLRDANGEINETPTKITCHDFERYAGSGYELIVGNPPYSEAEAHARRALAMRAPFGVVAFLLRLGFLESEERVEFWKEHPASKIFVLSQRPSFTGGGSDNSAYGLFVWASWWRGPTEVEVISWRAPSPRKGRKRTLDPNDPDAPHPPGIAPFSGCGTGEQPVGWKEFQEPAEASE